MAGLLRTKQHGKRSCRGIAKRSTTTRRRRPTSRRRGSCSSRQGVTGNSRKSETCRHDNRLGAQSPGAGGGGSCSRTRRRSRHGNDQGAPVKRRSLRSREASHKTTAEHEAGMMVSEKRSTWCKSLKETTKREEEVSAMCQKTLKNTLRNPQTRRKNSKTTWLHGETCVMKQTSSTKQKEVCKEQ